MTHLQKTGTGFLVRVFGTGFWCVCHWHKKGHSYWVSAANTCHNQKECRPVWPPPALTDTERRRRPWRALMHSSCNDRVIQLSPLSSYAVLEVVEISRACFVHLALHAVCPTHCGQLDLNPANLEAAIESRTNSEFCFFLWKRHFSMASRLRHRYVQSCKFCTHLKTFLFRRAYYT